MMHYSPDQSNREIAKQLREKSNVPVTEELARLSEQLDTDIRENLPPQMLAVVVGVLKLIEGVEEA